MQLIEVNTKRTKQEFLLLPVRLYKKEKNWIRPLDQDIEAVFDPKKNKYFRHGECIRWILVDDKNKTIGRVAAFIDRRTAKTHDQPTGGMGFFECIDDKKAAFLLFDQCKKWLKERGMEAMDGPINFGDRDKWWGLLVDGFFEPNYCMPYNFPYYQNLFEAYGFKDYFKQYTYHRYVNKEGLDDKIRQKAERIFDNKDYHFKHIESVNMLQRYAEDFRSIYNRAWAKHSGVKEMPKIQAQALMKQIKPIMDKQLMWFAYYKNEPVAFFLMLPEINQIIKHLNGNLNWWGKLKFLYHQKMKTCKKIFGVVFGVVPEHQGKGMEGALVMAFSDVAWSKNFHYKELELNWIGDFNPKMMHLVEQIGGKIRKTHITYRKIFDDSKPFKRAKII